MKEKKIIELYLRYLDNKDDYQKDFNESFNNLENTLKMYLEQLDIKDLIILYFEYATLDKFRANKNIEKLFELIYNVIFSKINELSLMKLVDLISVVVMDCYDQSTIYYVENKNRVNVRKNNLMSASFFTNELKNSEVKKEEYIKELNIFSEIVSIYEERILKVLNILLDDIILYTEIKLNVIKPEELDFVLITINSRIEKNSNIILKDKEYLDNEKNIISGSKINNSSPDDIKNKLHNEIKNLIVRNERYKNYQQSLIGMKEELLNLK